MKPTKVAVLGKVINFFFQGKTYVSFTFADGTSIQITAHYDDEGPYIGVIEYNA